MPLKVDGDGWGAIVLTRQAGVAVANNPVDRAEAIAEMAGFVIGYKEARARLRVVGTTDPLTGLPHERHFFQQLDRELARAMRTGTGVSVVLLEIDRFRLIVEENGPLLADRLLIDVGRLLDSLVRRDEVIARLDDNTFGWILAGVDQVTSTIATQRATSAVASATDLTMADLTLSAGICDIAFANDSKGMVRGAREALEWARVMGRGVIAHFGPEGPMSSNAASIDNARRRMGAVRSRGPVSALLRTLEAVDPAAGRHSERVGELAAEIALAMGWSETLIGAIRDAGCLHDIGMLCISAEILNKPGRLTEEEFSRVKQHTELGAEMAGKIVMPAQAAWIRGHHERWDGAGYPDGLEADEIPEGAAILALADAWDSMTMARTYAVMRTREDALTEVRREAGFQFSPAAVDGLERVFDVTSAPPPLQLEAPEPETLEAPTDIEDARSQE